MENSWYLNNIISWFSATWDQQTVSKISIYTKYDNDLKVDEISMIPTYDFYMWDKYVW